MNALGFARTLGMRTSSDSLLGQLGTEPQGHAVSQPFKDQYMILELKTGSAQTVGYWPHDPDLVCQDLDVGSVVVPSGC